MLAEPAESDPGAEPSADEPADETPVWRMFLRRTLRPRNLLWPAIAVAAAVMIMVMNQDRLPRRHGDRDSPRVAMTTKDAADDEAATIGPPPGAEKDADRRYREDVLRKEPGGVEGMSGGRVADGAKAFASREKTLVTGKDQPAPAGGSARARDLGGEIRRHP